MKIILQIEIDPDVLLDYITGVSYQLGDLKIDSNSEEIQEEIKQILIATAKKQKLDMDKTVG